MFDPYRKYKSCILCGNNEMTAEHIFGASFARSLGISKNWQVTPNPFLASQKIKKGSSPITFIKPKIICATCNTARLSGSMNNCLETLISFSALKVKIVDSNQVLALTKYFQRIAIIIDAETSSEQIDTKYKLRDGYITNQIWRQHPPLIPLSARKDWLFNNQTLENVAIYLGSHYGGLGLNPYVNIAHLSPFCKIINFVIKGMAVCLIIGNSTIPVPNSYKNLKEITSWPLKDKVTYDDCFSLNSQDTLTKILRNKIFIHSEFNKQIDELSFKNEGLTYPQHIISYVNEELLKSLLT